jgi:hypothetical protein
MTSKKHELLTPLEASIGHELHQKLVPGPSFGLPQNMADFTNMAELTG